jgi:hypothetical protein
MIDVLALDPAGEKQTQAEIDDVSQKDHIEGTEERGIESDARGQQARPHNRHDAQQEHGERDRNPSVELESIAETDEQSI